MALSLQTQLDLPNTVYGFRWYYRQLVEQFYDTGDILARINGIENPFATVGGLRRVVKYERDGYYWRRVVVVTRNGHIYLFRIDQPYSAVPATMQAFSRSLRMKRRAAR